MRTAKVVALGLLVGLLAGVGAWVDAGPTYDQIVLSDNPTAYWRFEEASTAQPAADSALGDGAQNGVYGGTAALVPGMVGQGVNVDPSGNGGFVNANNVNMTASFSAEAWARSDTANWNAWGWLPNDRGANGFLIHPDRNLKNWRGYVVSSGGGAQMIGAHVPADIQGWHHYAITFDDPTNTGIMFFDGVRVARNTGIAGARAAATTVNVQMGRDSINPTGWDRKGDGSLDEVAVYNSNLRAVQIRKHYQAAQGLLFVDGAAFGGASDPALDLDGVIVYAVNVGDTSASIGPTIRDATFTGENVPGVSVNSENIIFPAWGPQPNYGATPDDNALEGIMHSIRWDSKGNQTLPGIQVDLDLPNLAFPYRLQLFFSDQGFPSPGGRSFDLTIEGLKLLDEFDVTELAGAWSGAPTTGALLSYEFWPTDNQLNILLGPGSFYGNGDAILNAFTLEMVIPEPTTMTLLGLGALIAARRRRRK